MKHCIYLLIAALGMHQFSVAQPLSIGDPLPALRISNILNYDSSSLNTSRLKGKMILLDFGATTCIPCIKAMPLLDSLQKQFNGRLQVLMVTSERKEKVQQFLQKNKIAKNCSFPVVTEDSMLSALFPHTSLPHEVWINTEGMVAAITDHQYLTAGNIQQVLNDRSVNWPVKSDAISTVNTQIMDPFAGAKQLLYYSSFRNYLPGYKTIGIEKIDTGSATYHIRCVNYTIPDLYKMILGIRPGGFYPKQIKTDSSLHHRLFYDTMYDYKAAWEQKNKYCFGLRFPFTVSMQQLRQKLKQDLDIYLGIATVYEKRLLNCMVLQRVPAAFPPANEKNKDRFSLKKLMNSFNFNDSLPLLLNETGFSDLELNRFFIGISENEMNDQARLSQALQKAGFMICLEKRWVDILQFTRSSENQQ